MIEIMKGIFHWLTMNLPKNQASATENKQSGTEDDGLSVNTKTGSGESARIALSQPNFTDLMPDIYNQRTGDTQPNLEIIKEPKQFSDPSEGFNPYDTSSFMSPKK